MNVFFLAMALLVGGASVANGGALLGGLLGPLDCNDDIDLLIGIDTYYVADINIMIDAVVQLVLDVKAVANSVVVTIVIAAGDSNYASYPVVCNGLSDPVIIRAQLQAYAWVTHNNSPYSCLNHGQKYGVHRPHPWKPNHKRKYVHYCHDRRGQGFSKRGASQVQETRAVEQELAQLNINYGCVTYCPGCSPSDHTTFSLYAVLHESIFGIWYTYDGPSLLACIVDIVENVLCVLLNLLG